MSLFLEGGERLLFAAMACMRRDVLVYLDCSL
jgi:hypothetical protein